MSELLNDLTPREGEVLGLVAKGMSNRAIASRLTIDERTARTHVISILSKLGVENRTAATLVYLGKIENQMQAENERLKHALAEIKIEFDYLKLCFDKLATRIACTSD